MLVRVSLSSCAIAATLLLGSCSSPPDTGKAPAANGGSGGVSTSSSSWTTQTTPTTTPSTSSSPSASEHPLVTKLRNTYAEQGVTGEALQGIDLGGDVNTADGRFVEYPNGLRITFKGATSANAPLTRADGEYGKGTALMTVRVTIANKGKETIQLGDYATLFNAYAGPNLNELDAEAGYTDEDLISDVTAQVISPGSSIDVYSTYGVPASAPVALWVNTGDYFPDLGYTDYVFYGITAPAK